MIKNEDETVILVCKEDGKDARKMPMTIAQLYENAHPAPWLADQLLGGNTIDSDQGRTKMWLEK